MREEKPGLRLYVNGRFAGFTFEPLGHWLTQVAGAKSVSF